MSVPPITPLGAALRVQAAATAEGVLGAVVDAAMTAEAGASEPAAPTPAAPTPGAPATPPPLAQAIEVARALAAGGQASLAPLFADLAQAAGSPTLPAALKAAIGQVLALQTPLRGPLTAETVLAAVAQSGLFLEARLAGSVLPAAPAPTDLKAALLVLQAALAQAPPDQPQEPPSAQAAPQPPAAVPPPPPHRDAALAGQPPAPPALPTGAPASAIAQHLTGQVAQAVARQTLHQLASLPEGPASAWLFELPLATPQGTAIAQFEIRRDRDEPGADSSAARPTGGWRVRFSIDIEPLGPVHVQLAAAGEGARVTIWAEREGSLDHLRGEGEALARALPAEVVFRPGAPSRPIPASGQFVDQSS